MNRGIPCPVCGPTRWQVRRTAARCNHVARYRKCGTCGRIIETEERAKQAHICAVDSLRFVDANKQP